MQEGLRKVALSVSLIFQTFTLFYQHNNNNRGADMAELLIRSYKTKEVCLKLSLCVRRPRLAKPSLCAWSAGQ